ncbi:glycoside hydrolase family protein, partial [Nitrosomonas marina]|uniref:glycoside hydrolase family protein n=1 Tax=Nitrosomonas marina TaxID=917 RepID=UPI001C42F90F
FLISSVLRMINNPSAKTRYPNLEMAWKAWRKSQGRVMQGLINRRNAEWRIYSEGVYERW